MPSVNQGVGQGAPGTLSIDSVLWCSFRPSVQHRSPRLLVCLCPRASVVGEAFRGHRAQRSRCPRCLVRGRWCPLARQDAAGPGLCSVTSCLLHPLRGLICAEERTRPHAFVRLQNSYHMSLRTRGAPGQLPRGLLIPEDRGLVAPLHPDPPVPSTLPSAAARWDPVPPV